MAEKTQDILLRIGITGDKSVEDLKRKNTELLKTVLDNKKEIDNLAKANKELAKAEGDNSDAIAQNILRQKELQAAIKINQSQIGQNITLITSEMGALTEKRAQLANMTLEYSRMSAAEKADIEIGGKMQKSIKALSDDLKDEEKQIGITSRNVGNYTESIIEANKAHGLGNTMVGKAITSYKEFKDSAMAASGGTGVLNGALKMLAANPIMAIIAVIAAVFFTLKDAIGSSSKATNTLKEALAPLNMVFTAVKNVAVAVVQVFLDMFKTITSVIGVIASFVSANDKYTESIANAAKMEKERQSLAKANRDLMVNEAKNELEVAKLRDKVTEKDKYNRTQRAGFLSEAIEIEKKTMEEKKSIAQRELTLLENQLKVKDELNGEEKTKLAEAKAKLYSVETEYYHSVRRMKTQQANFNFQEDEAEAKAREDKAKSVEEARKKEEENQKKLLEMRQKATDTLLSIMKEGKDKELKQLDLSYKRELETITGKTKEANSLRSALKQKYISDQAAIDKKYSDEEIQKEVDKATKEVELKLSIAKSGSQDELDLRIQQLNLMRASELEAAQRLGIDKKLIEDKYNKQIADAKVDFNKQAIEKVKADQAQEFQNRILQMQLDGQSTLQVELDEAIKRRDSLVKTNDETEAQFTARKLKSEQDIKDITARMHDEEIKKIEMQQAIAEQIFSGLNSLGEIFAENSESLAEFAKVVGLFQIAVSTGVAIAKGIEGAMSVPFPANLLAITTTIATVLANVATAKKMLSSAGSAPKAPKFAMGGSVFGAGTGTSDSIPAYLSNGESVNTALSSAMFAPLLSALNQASGGAPIQSVNKSSEVYGEQFLANAFSKALLNMPTPVVSVEEITRVNNRVKLIESMARQ